MNFKPFLVIDRPNLLIPADWINSELPIGFMSHTYMSENFAKLWRDGSLGKIEKICDSGVFLKSNYQRDLTYEELFDRYESCGTNYGIILDVLHDREATLISAEKAITTYKKRDHNFKLIGVAQGESPSAYAECVRDRSHKIFCERSKRI